jgi:hypothetical protein
MPQQQRRKDPMTLPSKYAVQKVDYLAVCRPLSLAANSVRLLNIGNQNLIHPLPIQPAFFAPSLPIDLDQAHPSALLYCSTESSARLFWQALCHNSAVRLL